MPRVPIPPDLAGTPFRVADARAAGLGSGRLRGPDLERPFRGVRSVHPVPAAVAYAPLLRQDDRFSHTTGAELWPLPVPFSTALHVTATPPRNAPRGAGVIGHSARGRIVERGGLPVSDPLSLFVELATLLTERDLVAAGDALVLDPAVLDPRDLRPWVTLGELRS